MLQGVRDNLKGTTVSIVIIVLFIVPMVIAGVGSSFLGSVAGTDAAEVDGRSVSFAELDREVYLQKQRMLSQQGVDPSADYLKDENLRGPVLERLTRKAAMLAAADHAGMGVDAATVNRVIATQPDFLTDERFDSQKFRSVLSRIGLTPANFKVSVAEDLMLNQINYGLEASSFVTQAEKEALISLVHEKRTFFTVDIPSEGLREQVTVSDADAQSYYDENQESYRKAEQVAVEYIELSLAKLAETMKVDEAQVKSQYEADVAKFDAAPEYTVAHLLIEDGDSSAAKLAEVQAKLAEGEDFAELVKQYSDDAGTRDLGGSLGVVLPGIYPVDFEMAVYSLDSGEISAPVTSDAGTHLIKVLDKHVPKPPAFADRKAEIKANLQRIQAEELYTANLESLDKLTFSAPDLSDAAATLGLTVAQSTLFSRTSGTGIAGNTDVRNAAFAPEVLQDGHNSRIVELANNRAVVLHVKQHEPEHIQAFDVVKASIVDKLTQQQVNEMLKSKADVFVETVKSGEAAEKLAESLGYAYSSFEGATRSDPVSDPATRSQAFAIAKTDSPVDLHVSITPTGVTRVIGVTSREPGKASEVGDDMVEGLSSQLARENSRYEGSSFEAGIVSSAKIVTR